jgi:hypothetical protein
MTISLQWRIKYWDNTTAAVDLTSDVQSLTINTEVSIGSCGRSVATIVINNDDGAFTPGGTGTYANIDWFSVAFQIEQKSATGLYKPSFTGMVNDVNFEFVSVKESRFTLSLVDILAVGGRSNATTTFTGGPLGSPASVALQLFYNGYTDAGIVYYSGIDMPFIGGTAESTLFVDETTTETTFVTNDDFPAGRVGDWTNNNLLVTGPGTVYAVGLTLIGTVWRWDCRYVDFDLNQKESNAETYIFSDTAASLVSGELPYTAIDLQFNYDMVVNSCTADDQRNVFPQKTVTNTASTAKYGTRTVAFNSLCTDAETDVERVANFWPNRYSTARYTCKTLTTSLSTLKQAVDDTFANDEFSKLLSPLQGIWQRAEVSYVAPGQATQKTELLVINKIFISATPSDTTVVIGFLPGVDNQSFELNSSTYGILDTNRLA